MRQCNFVAINTLNIQSSVIKLFQDDLSICITIKIRSALKISFREVPRKLFYK